MSYVVLGNVFDDNAKEICKLCFHAIHLNSKYNLTIDDNHKNNYDYVLLLLVYVLFLYFQAENVNSCKGVESEQPNHQQMNE